MQVFQKTGKNVGDLEYKKKNQNHILCFNGFGLVYLSSRAYKGNTW